MRLRSRILMFALAAVTVGGICAHGGAQEFADLQASNPTAPPAKTHDPQDVEMQEPATIDGCEVVARINGQVVLACEVLWQVNRLLEEHRDKIRPEDYEMAREGLMRRYIAQLVDTKLLYQQFVLNVPPENMPQIDENLLKPFEEIEQPKLMKQLNVSSPRELEQELTRLGSSMADARRAFNERAIAQEWVRSKVKINEEVRPDELLDYYVQNAHKYEYPSQVRWEELMVRKSKYRDPRQAYEAMAQLGNAAWQIAAATPQPTGPLFTNLAKAKSDSFNVQQDGGVRDWTTKGAMRAAAIDQALFSLPVGSMSPILESDTGFHIVRVLERKEAGRTPFTEVQANIRDELKEERFHDAVEKYLSKLRRESSFWTVYTGPVSADVLMGRAPGPPTQRR